MHSEYIKRINKVLHHIENNLDAELSLQVVSEVAFYSPFHLHRLFKAITGETLNNYITRKRIERAALLLAHNPEISIRNIGIKYGFKNDSTFTRTFRKVYGQSPSAFRKLNLNNFSKIGKVDSNNGQASFITEEYLRNINQLLNWINMHSKIEIAEMPAMHLAFITQIGVEGIEKTFGRIVQWGMNQKILLQPNTYVSRVFHDSFKITDADKVRMSIGILSDYELNAQGEVETTILEKGKCIKGRFEIEPASFETAWNSLFIWMNENGYKKADRSPFEIYHNNSMDHPEGKCIVDLVIPIL